MNRFKGYPDPRYTWRTYLVKWLFGRRKIRSIGVGRGQGKLYITVSNLNTGVIITDVWITKEEAVRLAEAITRQHGLLDITS